MKTINYKNPFEFNKKVAIITGASGGIGHEAAKAFAQCGANLVLVGRNNDQLEELADEIEIFNGDNIVIRADLSDMAKVKQVVTKTIDKYGKIDFLLNNAGMNIRESILDVTEEHFDKIVDINFKAVYFLGQAVAKEMIKRGYGKIVNTSSVSGERAKLQLSVYAATKAAIVHLTRAMAHEFSSSGLNVNAIGPGYVRTKQTESLLNDKQKYDELMSRIPQGRFGEPQDMAAAMLFLCSPLADYVNGQTLYIDGARMVD